MKKINKLLSLLLAGLLVCGALASCGGSDDRPDRDDEDDDNDRLEDATLATTTGKDTVGDPDHDHEWSDWETTTEPTCGAEGVSTRTCSCGATENQPIGKTDHGETEWKVITAATPSAPGKGAFVCTACGTEVETQTIEFDGEGYYHADAAGYYSGYARVNGAYCDVIIDRNQDIVYACADGEEIEIYGNGYFISKQGDVQYLKKADGTVVCSTESLEIRGFGLVENYADYTDFLADGYIFAYNIIETYSGVTYEIGILGTDGKWIVPLSEDNPILSSGTTYTAATFNKHYYIYAGEGVLVLPVSDVMYGHKLYNIEDNKVYSIVSNVLSSNLDYMVTTAEFEDGVSYGIYGKQMYKICSDGQVTITTAYPDGANRSGFDFYVDEDGNYYTINSTAIYRNGQLYRELDFTVTGAECVGDVWLIFIKNDAGSYYYSYLTLEGELLVDPIATTATYICHEDGVGVSYSTSYVQDTGKKLVIDMEGNVLYTNTENKAYIYVNNGIVCEEVKSAIGSSTETFTALVK